MRNFYKFAKTGYKLRVSLQNMQTCEKSSSSVAASSAAPAPPKKQPMLPAPRAALTSDSRPATELLYASTMPAQFRTSSAKRLGARSYSETSSPAR